MSVASKETRTTPLSTPGTIRLPLTLLAVGAVFQFGRQALLGLFEFLDDAAVVAFLGPCFVNRLFKLVDLPADEALEVRDFRQLPVQPRRRNFQRVAARHGILNIEDGAKLAAEVGAVSVRHSRQRIATRRSGLVQKYAQHAGLATPAKLYLDHLKPAGGGYPLRNLPHAIKLKCHASNNLQPTSRGRLLRNEKVGLRPLVCFAKCRYYTTVLSFLIYARKGGKDKPPGAAFTARRPQGIRWAGSETVVP